MRRCPSCGGDGVFYGLQTTRRCRMCDGTGRVASAPSRWRGLPNINPATWMVLAITGAAAVIAVLVAAPIR